MMDDLISRKAAIDAIRAFYDEYIVYDNGKSIEDLISELPPVQPEIMRCKDCKYYTPVTARCEVRGKGLYLIRNMEDFCSRAEPYKGD